MGAPLGRIMWSGQAGLVLVAAGIGLREWTKLASDLQNTREQVGGVVTRLDDLAAGLQEGKGTAGRLLIDSALADNAAELLAHASEAMSQLQVMVTNLGVAVKDVQTGAARLPEITGTLANETRDLPGLVGQTQTSMRELERLIEALQRLWFVRKHVDHTDPPSWHPQNKTGKSGERSDKPALSPKDSR